MSKVYEFTRTPHVRAHTQCNDNCIYDYYGNVEAMISKMMLSICSILRNTAVAVTV